MSKKDDETPATRATRHRSKRATAPAPADTAKPGNEPEYFSDPLSRSPLIRAIEAERAQLLQAHALLKCLYQTLLYADAENTTLHADVANVAARLIDESVTRLDVVHLAPLVRSLEYSARPSASRPGTEASPQASPGTGQPSAGHKVEDRGPPYKVEDKPPYLC